VIEKCLDLELKPEKICLCEGGEEIVLCLGKCICFSFWILVDGLHFHFWLAFLQVLSGYSAEHICIWGRETNEVAMPIHVDCCKKHFLSLGWVKSDIL